MKATESTESNVTYLVALHNKLTGARGIMGMVRITPAARERVKQQNRGIYGRAEFFPRSIAARALEFREITAGSREAIVNAYGPEIES